MAMLKRETLQTEGQLNDGALVLLQPGDQVFYDPSRRIGSYTEPENLQSGWYEICAGKWLGLNLKRGLFEHPKDAGDVRILIQGVSDPVPYRCFSQYRLKQ